MNKHDNLQTMNPASVFGRLVSEDFVTHCGRRRNRIAGAAAMGLREPPQQGCGSRRNRVAGAAAIGFESSSTRQ